MGVELNETKIKQQMESKQNMSEAWQINASEACVVVKINGREERVNKGSIAELGDYISGKAAAAGIGKARVKIDGTEVEPDDIGDYSVADINTIQIDTFDVARK